jgi:Holliday junction resolvase RusA-like endonuclease
VSGEQYAFWVAGTPVEQGSKTSGLRKDGSPYMRDSNSKKLKPWREQVEAVAKAVRGATLTGPVEVNMIFAKERPKGHYGTGRNADVLKASAPRYPTTKPDIDKLQRSILDALTAAGCFTDDSYVISTTATKIYAARGNAGARITVRSRA